MQTPTLVLIPLLTFLLGAACGAVLAWLATRRRGALEGKVEERLQQHLRDTFGALAAKALEANSTHMLNLSQATLGQHTSAASQQLDAKQQVITTTLTDLKGQLTQQLTTVTERLGQLEKDRASQYSTLGQQLQHTHEQLARLSTTTADLKSALSNARVRGQWGERMADDVLRLAGLQEGVSYRRQGTLEGSEGTRSRPDFTFFLNGNRVIHMDVKFPLDGYLTYLEAPDDESRARARKSFTGAARNRIRETAAREYRTASTLKGEEPLDYVLVFIPNEQVYAFLLEHDADLLNEAIRQKIILCSPTTLLAVLAVVRQAMENFSLEKRTAEIQSLIAKFSDQWQKFMSAHDAVGEQIHRLQTNFNTLLTTRRTALERPLNKLSAHTQEDEADTPTPPLLGALTPREDLPN